MRKTIFFAFLTILIFALYSYIPQHSDTITSSHTQEIVPSETVVMESRHKEGTDHSSGDHGADMSPLFFIIIALVLGAATRHFLKKSPIPFTVMLLIIGLILGALLRFGWLERLPEQYYVLSKSIYWAGHIDPHLILYIFLPTLIFEAAFAMNFHTFKKTAVNVVILAVPGIIVAMLGTALLVMKLNVFGLELKGWGWPLALMFGAVVSATDPVAVVALLKELGASNKLGTLIEGESMLNDGTAIVLFLVFFMSVTGEVSGTHPVLEFLRVSLGGIVLGGVVGWLSIRWVRKVFNDALVEISVIVAAAYLTFYLSEYFFHVSGVLGLVTLGLTMASVGKARISPEVEHFLHEFWELAAFIANTLIFIIVGVVIAEQVNVTAQNLIILGILYVGVHIIRALVILIFYPLMRKSGYGLPKKDAVVVWYGALRGAVGLALALIIAGENRIPAGIRNDFLFLTAGLVLLTLLINATTIKYLVDLLGITQLSPAKKIMQHNAHKYLYTSSHNALEKAKQNKSLRRANWTLVENYLHAPVSERLPDDVHIDTIAEYRNRILEKEKSSYWHQFKEGLLGPNAVTSLTMTIENIIDQGGTVPLSQRSDLEESWKTRGWMHLIRKIPFLSRLSNQYFIEKLSVGYDSARAFVQAQEDTLKLVESMTRQLETEEKESKQKNMEILTMLEEEIKENIIHGQTFIRNLRKNYPEIYSAISTRLAIRTLLNYEKNTVERLHRNGRLENSEVGKLITGIEERMKRLMNTPMEAKLPDALSVLNEFRLTKDLDPEILPELARQMQIKIFPAKDIIIRENSVNTGVYFIARGTVRITVRGKDVEILHRGDYFGEIAEIVNNKRSANVTAESPVTVAWLSGPALKKLFVKFPQFKEQLWKKGTERIAFNLLLDITPYSHLSAEVLKVQTKKGKLIFPVPGEMHDFSGNIVVLVSGSGYSEKDDRKRIEAPAVLPGDKYLFDDQALVYLLPDDNFA